MRDLLVIFLMAFFITLIVTPIAKKLAFKVGAFDVPKDERKIHTKNMPYFGGIAIYISIMACTIVFIDLDKTYMSILIGMTILLLTGLVDDMYDMPAKIKLCFQILAASIVVFYGDITIFYVSNPFHNTGISMLDYLSVPISIIWIVGITNAINLIDGMDGLAAGITGIAALTFMITGLTVNYTVGIVLSAIVAGSTMGFLPNNFYPAKIFMGDAGSMVLGFILSVIAMLSMVKGVAIVTIMVPVFTIGLPILDTAFAIFRRLINHKPIMQPDKEHLHHQLMKRGLNQKQTVLILYCISILLGTVAVIISNTDIKAGEIIGVLVGIVIIVLAKKMNLLRKNIELDNKKSDKEIEEVDKEISHIIKK